MNGNLIGFLSLGTILIVQTIIVAFWAGKVSEAILNLQKDSKNTKTDIKDVRERLDTHLQGGKV